MKLTPLVFALVALAGMIIPGGAARGEEGPAWQTDWQRELAKWLQSLTPEDVSVQERDFQWGEMDPAEMHRNWHLSQNYAPTLAYANLTLKIPAQEFTWAGVWRRDLPVTQGALKKLGLEQGQIWTPTHPSLVCPVAWLYGWERPWNPYFRDPAVARRAAVMSAVTLIMTRASSEGENVHMGILGFGLTFHAYSYECVAEVLPDAARNAWADGLRWLAETVFRANQVGPENMQLSVPVGIYRAGIALGDEELKRRGVLMMEALLASHYSLAGYIRDAGVPDASYNGISIHRLAEFWAMTKSPQVLEVLRKMYRLKNLNILPEPEGETLSPSHFNARCQDGFDCDQYQGREVMLLPEVPEAAYLARERWGLDLTHENLITHNKRAQNFKPEKFSPPEAWGTRTWKSMPHDWGRVLGLPYVLYHSSDAAVADALIRAAEVPHILANERYTTSLGGEFHFIRRPAYGAIFYTGPARLSDNSATNLHGVLQGAGGYQMGFAGGGLSAFWTPKGGSLILGRMSGREGYERLKQVGQNNRFDVPGWQDWLNNQLVGETMDGKVVTSSRTPRPSNRMNEEGSRLEIRGEIPKRTPRQGQIMDATLAYQRVYRFEDDRIECEVEVSSDQALALRSFYETLPLVLTSGRQQLGNPKTAFLDAQGNEIAPVGERYEGVHAVRHSRFGGGVRIVFPQPVTIAMISEPVSSNQMRRMLGRSLLIELPPSLNPAQPIRLAYQIFPEA